MNPCIHFAFPERIQHSFVLKFHPTFPAHYPLTFPKLPPHYIPTSPTVTPHYSPTLPNLSPHSTHTLFPPCHFTSVIHLFHLPSSPLSHLSQLTSLPTTNRHFQTSNLLSLSRQSKGVWMVVRRLLMRAGWWDAPLAFRDLVETINITQGLQYQKLKNLPSRETITDRRNGNLPCCPLGH